MKSCDKAFDKLLKSVNLYIPGELRLVGSRFVYYVYDIEKFSISFGSVLNAYWLLRGVLLVRRICEAYRKETNRFGTQRQV